MKKLSIFILAIILSSCGGKLLRSESQVTDVVERNDFLDAEKVLFQGNFERSHTLFKTFQRTYPQSYLYQSSRLGEAKALEGLGRWTEAVQIYQDVYKKTLSYQGEIAAEAMYNMSFAYEALGDDLRTVSSLLDAKKLGRFLPPEVAEAEIPARLAIIYSKLGREREARNYLAQAERGLQKVLSSKRDNMDRSWLAKTYFQMGNASTNQLSVDSFERTARGFYQVQSYLLKALQLSDPVWSKRSLQHLQQVYRDFLNTLKSVEVMDPLRPEMQNQMGGALIDLMNQADLYRPLSNQKMNSFQNEFYIFLKDVRQQVQDVLYSGRPTTVLTPESQELNSLKRLLPVKEKSPISLPPKVVPSEDPNL